VCYSRNSRNCRNFLVVASSLLFPQKWSGLERLCQSESK
jgi:hypothetical protein